MELIGMALLVVGGLTMLIGGVMMLFAHFRVSIWWGLGCIFIPFVSLLFLVCHWDEAKKPFLTSMAGLALGVVGIFLAPSVMETEEEPAKSRNPDRLMNSSRSPVELRSSGWV